jgi:hypothetical protein
LKASAKASPDHFRTILGLERLSLGKPNIFENVVDIFLENDYQQRSKLLKSSKIFD